MGAPNGQPAQPVRARGRDKQGVTGAQHCVRKPPLTAGYGAGAMEGHRGLVGSQSPRGGLAAPNCSTREQRQVLGRGGPGSSVRCRELLTLELRSSQGTQGRRK